MFHVIMRNVVDVGGGGGGGGGVDPAVVNDHTGPVVVPALFFARICQKYFVPPPNPGGAYQ
jgi:hypothetical protein